MTRRVSVGEADRTYVTLARPARAEIEVKRSRFLADLARVEDEDAARAFIEGVRAGSRDARHHCTAFVLGADGMTERSNDDGEPSGTAGTPMLDVLRGAGLTDVVAVVTRWFGGTLLGTGGLIRAYGDAVRAALDEAALQHRALRTVAELEVGHAVAPRVENALRTDADVTVLDVAYGARGVTVRLAYAPSAADLVGARVAELTHGGAHLEVTGEAWVDVAGA